MCFARRPRILFEVRYSVPLFVYARRNYPILQLFVWSEFYLVTTVSGPDKRVFCPGKNVWATQKWEYRTNWPLIKVESLQSALKESQANSDRMEQNLAERLRQATTSLTAVQGYKVQKSWRCGAHAAGATDQGRM